MTTRIMELARDDLLAAHYDRVPALLEGADEHALERAGRVLARLDVAEVTRLHPEIPVVKAAIVGHGTLGPLVPVLTAELARHGLLLDPVLGDYDGYLFELSDPDGAVHTADPDLVLCVLDPAVVLDELPTPWRPEDAEAVLDAKLRQIEAATARFAEAARGTLVLNTLPLQRYVTAQLVDHRSRARLGATWREANLRLLRLTEAHPSVITIDLDPLIAEGLPAVDRRLDVYAGVHLSPALLARYAREAGHLARHLAGRTKKALVLDLDGTLWGGVLGDDGVEGIEVSGGYRGAGFQAFQRVVKQIGSQGVLLAAVSKNDLEPVREALRKHPDLLLREDDFTRIIANWRPKTDNLVELAGDLNLGVDAFVFVDDSPFECGLVRSRLPCVAVVQVDDEPALHAAHLLADGWFDVREVTADDRARPRRYREDLARRDFLGSFDSIEDYLAELDVRVRLEPAGEREVARVSQLTLRTNQFNMTTRRLQPDQVRAMMADPAWHVMTVRASDRFGDNGLVGAVFLHREGPVLRIDNFLLSCRVFARGIEQACLHEVLTHAAVTQAREVTGSYRPTPKNGKVRDFYLRHGFTEVAGDGPDLEFRHDLRAIAPRPAHVTLTARWPAPDPVEGS